MLDITNVFKETASYYQSYYHRFLLRKQNLNVPAINKALQDLAINYPSGLTLATLSHFSILSSYLGLFSCSLINQTHSCLRSLHLLFPFPEMFSLLFFP